MYMDMWQLVGQTLGQCVSDQKVVARRLGFSFVANNYFSLMWVHKRSILMNSVTKLKLSLLLPRPGHLPHIPV